MNLWFADAEVEDVIMSWHKMSGATRDGLVMFGAVLAVTLVITIWAMFIRKKKRAHSHHHSEHSHHRSQTKAEEKPKRRKWRRRRREHRPRNPTLAETGGLPPVRSEGNPDVGV